MQFPGQMRGMFRLICLIAVQGLVGLSGEAEVLLEERFDHDTLDANWWVEGGEAVEIADGRLWVKADPVEYRAPGYVCTVWHREPIAGDVRITFDAHVLGSSRLANNINFFLFYTDPTGAPLPASQADRADGAYPRYHDLNGYILTLINAGQTTPGDKRARMRMRRNPGFELLDETFDYHCRPGRTYQIMITRRGGRLEFAVDGTRFLTADDPQPWASGHIGFRTFHTDLWWDNLVVKRLEGESGTP
jgi:hypothetical protein